MHKQVPILLGLIFICIAVWLLMTPSKYIQSFIERLNALGYDLQLHTRVLTSNEIPTSPIAIIDIDDRSLKAEGRWPWPREKLAILVDKIEAQGAAVIAFDMFFAEQENNIANQLLNELRKKNLMNKSLEETLTKNAYLFNKDDLFAASLKKIPSILAIGFLPHNQQENALPPPLLTLNTNELKQLSVTRAQGYISNYPIIEQAAKGSGFINIFPDSDGIIRHAPLLMEYQGGIYPALSLQAVLTFLGEDMKLFMPSYGKKKQLEGIQIGSIFIPTDAKGEVLIPFIGKSYSFPYYSATDVIHNNIPADALTGKIIFIGTSATGSGDLKATSIETPFPGVEIQATLINGMLTHHFSYKPAWTFGAIVFITILLGSVASFLFPYFGPRLLGLLVVILPIGLLLIDDWIWVSTGLVISFLVPIILVLAIALINIIYGYLFESLRRERLNDMFGQYVPKGHIDEMLQTSGDYGLRGEDREMSVLFIDIRDFTTISETLSAVELVELLNIYLNPMTEIIFKHRGTVDKYVGDLIMAFWGAPLKDELHAEHAIEAALEMQKKIKTMHHIFAERDWPEIKIGIGINSGNMSIGDMGSRFRRNYTVLGDAVNLASRIEGLTKFYGVDIIVTENCLTNQSQFIVRKLDRVRVKGKMAGIEIYEIVCTQAEANQELIHELKIYHEALDCYFHQQWDDAAVLMKQLHDTYPSKKIYHIYQHRIKEFKEHHLPADWDGIYVHVTK